MLNRVVLIGRLTKDPELRYTQSNIAVASFTLAVDRAYKSNGEKETDFIDVVVWRQAAENCVNYLSKGKLAAVDGRIAVDKYTGTDGKERKTYRVVADNVRFLSPKSDAPTAQQEQTAIFPGGDDDLPY